MPSSIVKDKVQKEHTHKKKVTKKRNEMSRKVLQKRQPLHLCLVKSRLLTRRHKEKTFQVEGKTRVKDMPGERARVSRD